MPASTDPPTDAALAAYDQVGLAVLRCRADGRIAAVNRAFTQLTGRTTEQSLGRLLPEAVALEYSCAVKLNPLLAARSAFQDFTCEARSPDGTLLYLSVSAHPADDRGDLWLVLRDDSQNHRLRNAVQTQLQLATELGGIGIWREDLARRMILANDQFFHVLGLPVSPQGLSFADALQRVHPEDVPRLNQARAQVIEHGGSLDAALRYRQADGSWRYVLTRRALERDGQGKPVALVGVALDVSERFARSERELELARQLEMAANAAGLAIWSWSPETDEAQWNGNMWRLHGLTPEARGLDFQNYAQRFAHPDDRAAVHEAIVTLLKRRQGLVEMDVRVVREDGSMRRAAARASAEVRNGVLRLFGIMLDVTEQHAAQERLRAADERSVLVARGAGIGTWEMDFSEPGSGAWWDEQMWRLRGRAPQPQTPSHDERMAMVHPADRAALEREYQAAEQENRPTHMEFRVQWPDGSWHWLASRSVPLRDELGRPSLRRIGINWDVTAARNADQARQERMLARRESQAKSMFLARMSHELRTPLNAVLGFTQLLLAEGDEGPADARRKRLELIQGAGRHLLSLINDVLDLSSLESGQQTLQLRPVPLQALMDETLPLLDDLAQRHGVHVTLGALDAQPMADATRLRQVMLNLLSNGIKYNRPDGTVEVSAHTDAGQAVIRVCDDGPGIEAHKLVHVFEPFNRLGAEARGIEGTGIGLAIVKATVEHMGGTVRVDSRVGAGTTFELRLAGAASPAEAAPAPPQDAAPAVRGGRVLYIEDNAVNVLIVSELVARRGDLTLDAAADGEQGVMLAQSLQPDLVLVDMQLPDIDGLEVLRRLRGDPHTARIPCVALSANAMPEDIRRARQAGFDDYWTKPLDFPAFMAALERLFGPAPQ